MSQSVLKFRIDTESREKSPDGWEYSAYAIVTSYQGQMFTSHRRFRDFRDLHKKLSAAHIPTLPKHFPLWPNIFNRYAPDVIEVRKVGLARYLTDVVAALADSTIPQVLLAASHE